MNYIIQKNPVPPKLPIIELKPFHKIGPLSFYGTTRYEWAHRHNTKNRTTLGPNKRLTRNNPAWAD